MTIEVAILSQVAAVAAGVSALEWATEGIGLHPLAACAVAWVAGVALVQAIGGER
jgi:hypothetical protein